MIKIKNNSIKTSLVLMLFLTLFSIYNCSYIKHSNQLSIKTIKLLSSFDIVKVIDGEFFNTKDSLIISYYKDFILIQIPVLYTYSEPINQGDSTIEKIIEQRVYYTDYLYKESNPFGYKYDSLTATKFSRFSVDSFWGQKPFSKLFPVIKEKYKLYRTDTAKQMVIEKYIPLAKYDETYPDSTYYYYNPDLKGLPFSFSPYLDRLHKKKLFKLAFVFNPIPIGMYKFEVPKRRYYFELKETHLPNQKEIIDFIEKADNTGIYK